MSLSLSLFVTVEALSKLVLALSVDVVALSEGVCMSISASLMAMVVAALEKHPDEHGEWSE